MCVPRGEQGGWTNNQPGGGTEVTMRIATYNVWNENKGIGDRTGQILDEIRRVSADVIALQEITPQFYENCLSGMPEYPYTEFGKYTREEEGLAILSRLPFTAGTFLHTDGKYARSCALNVLFESDGRRISLTDVHLPWDSIKAKEEQIVAIDRFCHEQKNEVDYFVVLGDFNCGLNSSVHRFMTGNRP